LKNNKKKEKNVAQGKLHSEPQPGGAGKGAGECPRLLDKKKLRGGRGEAPRRGI